MRPEFEKKLKETFPSVLKKVRYIECKDGWYNLIYSACLLVQAENTRNEEKNLPKFEFVQIKEKFGTLRAYMSGTNDYCRGVVSNAEYLSGITCEECGTPGRTRVYGGFWTTLCQSCADKFVSRTGREEEFDEEDEQD